MTHPEDAPRPANAIAHPACGNWWTGLSRSHCPSCCQTFSSETAADRHRKGSFGIDRRCINPAEAGLVAVDKPWGRMWQTPAPETADGAPPNWARTAA